MVDIQWPTAEIRWGKKGNKKDREKEETTGWKYVCPHPAMHGGGHKQTTRCQTMFLQCESTYTGSYFSEEATLCSSSSFLAMYSRNSIQESFSKLYFVRRISLTESTVSLFLSFFCALSIDQRKWSFNVAIVPRNAKEIFTNFKQLRLTSYTWTTLTALTNVHKGGWQKICYLSVQQMTFYGKQKWLKDLTYKSPQII